MSFYKELNNLSTADFYECNSTSRPSKRKASSASREFFEVERVISRRIQRGKVSDIL